MYSERTFRKNNYDNYYNTQTKCIKLILVIHIGFQSDVFTNRL